MDDKQFEKLDKQLTDNLERLRSRQVPPAILKGFSTSVEAKLRKKGHGVANETVERKRVFVPHWAPVLAILVIAIVFVSRPGFHQSSISQAPDIVEVAAVATEEIADEIDALRELGVWTEEDELSVGVLDDFELSDRPRISQSTLA